MIVIAELYTAGRVLLHIANAHTKNLQPSNCQLIAGSTNWTDTETINLTSLYEPDIYILSDDNELSSLPHLLRTIFYNSCS